MNTKYTVISTFAGCGGSSLGYKMAGFKELLAIDFDKNSVDTFKKNFPEVPVFFRDISGISAGEILKFCKIKKKGLDVLDGSPPCQGFSICGKKRVNDPRNDLFKEFVRLIEGLAPKVFVMENVSGMAKGKMKGCFIYIFNILKSLDYNVRCRMMNAKYYNVPQSRERLIFMGVRKDLKINPSFPKASNKLVSIREVMKGVEPKTFVKSKRDFSELYAYLRPGKSLVQCVPKDVLLQYAPRLVNNPKLTTAGFGSRLEWDKPAFTVTRTNTMTATRFVHPEENRILSIEELKRVATFPDNFVFVGSPREQWARIGNCVPPKFMQSIALLIKEDILAKHYGEA